MEVGNGSLAPNGGSTTAEPVRGAVERSGRQRKRAREGYNNRAISARLLFEF